MRPGLWEFNWFGVWGLGRWAWDQGFRDVDCRQNLATLLAIPLESLEKKLQQS